jgi:predicted nucleic acid-binding protein
MKFLLDINVLSELTKPKVDQNVLKWFDSVAEEHLFVSVLTLGEISLGIGKLPEGKKRNDLIYWFDQVQESFKYQCWPVDKEVALKWGELSAFRLNDGHSLPILDGLIAATAYVQGAILVTRNTKYFKGLMIQTLNPWY